jgi:hypothetical protein
MLTRMASVFIALPNSVLGHLLFFWGTGRLASYALAGRTGELEALAFAAAVVGCLLVGVAMLSAAWSSVGVMLTAVLQIPLGIAAVLVTVPSGSDATALNYLDNANADVGLALIGHLIGGGFVVTGTLFAVVGLAARQRRHGDLSAGRTGLSRTWSLLIAILVLIPGVLLVLLGAVRNADRQLTQLHDKLDPLALGLLAGGVLAMAFAVFRIRRSSLGAIVVGPLATTAGATGLLRPDTLDQFSERVRPDSGPLPAAWADFGLNALTAGNLLLWGVLLIAAAVAGKLAGQAGARRADTVKQSADTPPEEPLDPAAESTRLVIGGAHAGFPT